MRDKLNSNPIMQLAVIGVLLLGGVLFLMSTMGGGSSKGEEPPAASSTALTTAPSSAEGLPPAESSAALPPAGTVTGGTPTLPKPVLSAWEADRTVVLLFVRDGGIDDRLVRGTVNNLSAFPGVKSFVVPAAKISRYTAVTEGVGVERVPALVVMTPKRLEKGTTPTASVSYGFQSPASIAQAVIDAGYRGPTVEYHP